MKLKHTRLALLAALMTTLGSAQAGLIEGTLITSSDPDVGTFAVSDSNPEVSYNGGSFIEAIDFNTSGLLRFRIETFIAPPNSPRQYSLDFTLPTDLNWGSFVYAGGDLTTGWTVTLSSDLRTVNLVSDPFTLVDNADRSSYFEYTVSSVAAVPEPSSYALMLAGLAAAGLVARRRSRHTAPT